MRLRTGFVSAFWWRWVAANALAELVGLGTVAALGHVAVSGLGEPAGAGESLLLAGLFVFLGAFEGLVVGLAQRQVLSRWLPDLQGWVRATMVGAIAAWVLGMLPSTIMSSLGPADAGPPPVMSASLQFLLAAGLGMVAGPMLAFFQWRRLRTILASGAGWWLPANAGAWALGMPLIFAGAHRAATAPGPAGSMLAAALSFVAAGAVVGAVHGGAMAWLIARHRTAAP